jgi:hypothetical protein
MMAHSKKSAGSPDAPTSGSAIVPCDYRVIQGDARSIPLPSQTVDLVVTSPPYWRKRDYGIRGQIGQEESAAEYVAAILAALREWKRLLRPMGSVFLDIGDTYHDRSLAGIPGRIAAVAMEDGWLLRNQIVWAKDRGMPGPVKDRLVSRHEYILHLAKGRNYYYDLFGYAKRFGKGANPGDVWQIRPTRDMSDHLAPFPEEIAERAIILACPEKVCPKCGSPSRRIVERTTELDMSRPQARRAMELVRIHGLTPEHLAAIQAVGVSDAGKALRVQNGTGRNSDRVKKLAAEAKKVLGGYFREFTFAQRRSVGWTDCGAASKWPSGSSWTPSAARQRRSGWRAPWGGPRSALTCPRRPSVRCLTRGGSPGAWGVAQRTTRAAVIRVEAVKASLTKLTAQRIHPAFSAYLCIRRTAAAAGRITNLRLSSAPSSTIS